MKFLLPFVVILLTACSNVDTKPSHDHDHNHGADQYNTKVLNCVGPSGHHVYEEEIVCPLDGEKFTALNLGTHSTMGLHLDWQPISYMLFPVAIPICPKSGFIVDQEKYTDEELAKRKVFIESADYQKLYKEKHATFFLFAKQSEALKENPNNLYWFYLKATWEADGCGDQKRYNQYAALVIEKAKERKTKLTVKDDEYWAINMIITDMYRRTSQFALAQEYLNTIGKPEFEDPEANDFYLLAKSAMQKAIDEKIITRVPIEEPEAEIE